jgi:hypothetical protein
MREIVSNPTMVAYCGLYCGACRRYLKEGCPGCHDNQKANWCKVRRCCVDNHYTSCADCVQFRDPVACKKFNNIMAKLFALMFKSDRAACIGQIRRMGIQGHADEMTKQKRQSLRKQQ